MEALRFDGVAFAYGNTAVLRNASFAIQRGELRVLQGRSGSGKSTLLRIGAGLVAPSSGQVRLLGKRLPPPERTAGIRANHVGIVFQHLNLLDELSVAENIALPLRLRHVPRAQRDATTRQLLQLFHLSDLGDRRPTDLSGGEQQRVAIARALAPRPEVLLVDEPTSHLDHDNAQAVIAALEAAAGAGAAVLVAAHDELLTKRPGTLQLRDGVVAEVVAHGV